LKYVTFSERSGEKPVIGLVVGDNVLSLPGLCAWVEKKERLLQFRLPETMLEFIQAGEPLQHYVRNLLKDLENEDPKSLKYENGFTLAFSLKEVVLHAPLPRPVTFRDFYAFEAHVAAAKAARGQSVPDEWYRFPVFYFSNPNPIFGPEDNISYPSYTRKLDFELEVACIIGKEGINIPAENAGEYIFGYTILNDWSARDVQREETKVGLGPAKAKDFASSLGPWIVTPDELQDRFTGRPGVYDLEMRARINGKERSCANWKDLHYSFGEMIARASQEVRLLPGEVIGSGTVGTGCLLDLTKGKGPWLQPGDEIELEVERLGVLKNRIVKSGKLL
jgi:fumarylacetoacetate (FAA) hydrolase